MKNILFIQGNIYPQNVGGAEIFDYYLIRQLSRFFKMHYISTHIWPEKELKGYKIPIIKPLGIFFPLIAFLIIIKNRKKNNFIHLRYSRSRWINWWPYPILKKAFGINYLITIHGGGLTPWKFKCFYQWFFRNATGIIGISERICNEYEKRTGIKVKYIPPLLPFEYSKFTKNVLRKKNNIHQEARIFLFVGSLKRLKNPNVIIKSFINLGRDYLRENNIILFIAGDGPLKLELENLIKKFKLKNFIRLLGNVPREQIIDFYKLSDYYIITSDFEGTPIAMLEAMFNKLSIIASNSPGINNIIHNNENGLLFPANDYIELAAKIKSIISDDNLASNIAKTAYTDFKSRFSYENVLEAYKNIFMGI